MGLLSSLFGSDSHSQNTQSTSNVTNTQLAGGSISGPATYGSGNYTSVVATDAGSIKAATDISDHALALGAAEASTGASVAIAGITQGANLGEKALDLTDRFGEAALNANSYIAGKSLDALSESFSASLTSLASNQQGTLGTVEQLAAQVSQSNQQATDQTITRVIWALAIAAVAILVIPKLK